MLFLFYRMPCEVKPRFVILYGSQKGQAQSIAEGLAEEAEEHGLVAILSCLNEKEKVFINFFFYCVLGAHCLILSYPLSKHSVVCFMCNESHFYFYFFYCESINLDSVQFRD